MSKGALPVQFLRELLHTGFIAGVDDEFLNPGSLDLPLSDEAYRLESTFLPLEGETVRSNIKAAGGDRYSLSNPLEAGVPYLIRIAGKYKLPSNVYGYANPKSSTGRLNVLVRMMGDHVPMYDAFTGSGWAGEMWALVRAESFRILVRPGLALSQLRLFDGKSFLDELELQLIIKKHGLFFHPDGSRFSDREMESHTHADSFFLTIGLPRGVAGWECRGSNKMLNLSKEKFYKPQDFFTPVYAQEGRLHLRKHSFYILTSYEHLAVPTGCAAELRAMDPRLGEFRSHSAGFFDPGWGVNKRGRAYGQPITLEITPHEDLTVKRGQTIGRVRYERMKEVPEVLYSSSGRSNYTGQLRGAKLSKHFKQ